MSQLDNLQDLYVLINFKIEKCLTEHPNFIDIDWVYEHLLDEKFSKTVVELSIPTSIVTGHIDIVYECECTRCNTVKYVRESNPVNREALAKVKGGEIICDFCNYNYSVAHPHSHLSIGDKWKKHELQRIDDDAFQYVPKSRIARFMLAINKWLRKLLSDD